MGYRVVVHRTDIRGLGKLILGVELEIIELKATRGVREVANVYRPSRVIQIRMAIHKAKHRRSDRVVDARAPDLLTAGEKVSVVRCERTTCRAARIVDLHIS